MQILRRDDDVVFMTTVEDWMEGQTYTEVFNFSTAPITADEMELTDVLDKLLGEVLNQIPNVDGQLRRFGNNKHNRYRGGGPRKVNSPSDRFSAGPMINRSNFS